MEILKRLSKLISSRNISITLLNMIGILIICHLLALTYHIWGNILYKIFIVIKPFVIGFAIAFILEPVIRKLELHIKYRKLAILFVYVFVLLFFMIIFSAIIPLIINSITGMFPSMSEGMDTIQKFIIHHFNYDISSLFSYIYDYIASLLQVSNVVDTTIDVFNRMIRNITNVTIYVIISIYISANYAKCRHLIRDVSKHIHTSLPVYLKEAEVQLNQYVKAFVISAFIQGILCSLIYLFIGHPYWFVLALATGISSIFPYIGPITINCIGFITTLSFSLPKAMLLLVIIFIHSNIMAYFIQPKIYSKQININLLLVLFGILAGNAIFGIYGMLIAMPTLVIMKIFIQLYFKRNPQ